MSTHNTFSTKILVTALTAVVFTTIGAKTLCQSAGTAMDFINQGMSVRFNGMGTAFVGLADDVSAITINPAGIAITRYPGQFAVSHHGLYNHAMYNTLGYVSHNNSLGYGFALTNLYASTSLIDSENQNRGDFIVNNTGFSLGLGTTFIRNALSLGIVAKTVLQLVNNNYLSSGSSYEPYTGIGIGYDADAGILIRPIKYLSFGVTLRNILGDNAKISRRRQDGSYTTRDIIMYAVYGTALRLFDDMLLFTYDYNEYNASNCFGLEFNYKILSLRAGFTYPYITVGVGIGGKSKFDFSILHQYSSSMGGVEDNIARASYVAAWGKETAKSTPLKETQKRLATGVQCLNKGDLKKARKFADSALKIDKTNVEAMDFIAKLDLIKEDKTPPEVIVAPTMRSRTKKFVLSFNVKDNIALRTVKVLNQKYNVFAASETVITYRFDKLANNTEVKIEAYDMNYNTTTVKTMIMIDK
ncbi:MAG: UPF0164 family protein [Elusimicrobiota bacterium]